MKKRTKVIILSLMIVLLGVTGYLNIVLNDSLKDIKTGTTSASYFTSYRNLRESLRDQELLYYDAIIDSPSATEVAINNAYQTKMELIGLMEKEFAVEKLIEAQGFSDCVISLSGTKINVVVKGTSLTTTEVAKITTVVVEQLGVSIKNIIVMSAE